MMRTFAIINHKGGCSKTTTAGAILQAATYKGKKALAIDLDPQGNLSFILQANTTAGNSFDLLQGKPIEELIQTTPQGIDIIPASLYLSTIATAPGSALRLQKALAPIQGKYDYVIIDTPPTSGELQYNALQAATDMIIPLKADVYNLQGLYQIMETANQFKKSNPALNFTGCILTQYDSRSTINKQMATNIQLAASVLHLPFIGTVKSGIAIVEALSLQRSLYEYAPNSKPAQDYLAIFEQLDK